MSVFFFSPYIFPSHSLSLDSPNNLGRFYLFLESLWSEHSVLVNPWLTPSDLLPHLIATNNLNMLYIRTSVDIYSSYTSLSSDCSQTRSGMAE